MVERHPILPLAFVFMCMYVLHRYTVKETQNTSLHTQVHVCVLHTHNNGDTEQVICLLTNTEKERKVLENPCGLGGVRAHCC